MRLTLLTSLLFLLTLDPSMVRADGVMGILKTGAGTVAQGMAFGSIAAATNFLFTGLFNHRKNMNEALAKERMIAEAELELEKLKAVGHQPTNTTASTPLTPPQLSEAGKGSSEEPEEDMDEVDRALLHHQHLSSQANGSPSTTRKDPGSASPSTYDRILINATVVNGTVVDATQVNATQVNATQVKDPDTPVPSSTILEGNTTISTPSSRRAPIHRSHRRYSSPSQITPSEEEEDVITGSLMGSTVHVV
ncbi:MAG: hypothetical protein DHS80DRAFT_22706 [Piptocephalis tieghemiana]|nr:MAG: hypothetical protein DHS80DRAFT_22706 [Piptocephalis tieghemiana]